MKADYFENSRPTYFYFEDYFTHQGKRKAYSLIILFCSACLYTTVDIMPTLERNILNFGYEICYKYEGILSGITFGIECSYLHIKLDKNTHAVKHLPYIRHFCSKIIPFIYYYKKQVDSYNKTVHNILTKAIPLILLTFKMNNREKKGINTTLVTGFIGLAYEGISGYIIKDRKLYKKHLMLWKEQ